MIDDCKAWNPNLCCKCFFYKKAGATHSGYIQGQLAYHYTHRFGLLTSQRIHRGFLVSLSLCVSFSLSLPPLTLLATPCQNFQALNPNKKRHGLFFPSPPSLSFRLHLLRGATGWSLMLHKSDDKIINGSRAMSYLISCIFMNGVIQLGPCAMKRQSKRKTFIPPPCCEESDPGD